jgi:outer membrane protein assembly factor BamB
MPTAHETISAGRRIRRRRRLTQTGVALAAVAVLGVGAALVGGNAPDRSNPDPTATDPQGGPTDLGVVFAVDDTVYLDGGAAKVRMPEVAQTLYYTSAGLLVRTNKTGASDGGAPFHFQLVGADGTAQPLDLTLGEVVPSTDPTQPYVAYSEADGDAVRVVVDDVTTGEQVARVAVTGLTDWGGWAAPPVALDGDTVYVSDSTHTLAVDWRTGQVVPAEHVSPGPPTVVGGRTIATSDTTAEVVDVDSGDVLFESGGWLRLSPDGRYAVAGEGASGVPVQDLEDGGSAVVGNGSVAYGWTADDQLVAIVDGELAVCSPESGRCTTSPLPDGVSADAFVRLPGFTYES